MAILTRLESMNELIHEAVEKGATSVEQIHQTIAALPFEELERRGLLGELPTTIKQRQAQTIGAIYDAIRSINQEVDDMAAGILKALQGQKDEPKPAAEAK